MSSSYETSYNRFQHAATNTAPLPSSTPVPLSRSGAGVELLQALRVSGESGGLRPRRESMDSFNSLHRFTQLATNGMSFHGQSAEASLGLASSGSRTAGSAAVVPAQRTAPPAVPRPASGTGVAKKTVWASSHFTYDGHEATADESSHAAEYVVNDASTDGSPIVSRENHRGSDPLINSRSNVSPVAPASRVSHSLGTLRYSQSTREDNVRLSYPVTASRGENFPSGQITQDAGESPRGVRRDDVDVEVSVDYGIRESQEEALATPHEHAHGMDVHRPNGGVPTMLRQMAMVRPRIPAINESVDVVAAAQASARRDVAVPASLRFYNGNDENEQVNTSQESPQSVMRDAAAADGPVHRQDTERHDSPSEFTDEPSQLEPASIPDARRRASYERQLQRGAMPSGSVEASATTRGSGALQASLPSVRSVPVTRDVRLDELDSLVPQARPPAPPSSAGTSKVASTCSTPALPPSNTASRQSNPSVATHSSHRHAREWLAQQTVAAFVEPNPSRNSGVNSTRSGSSQHRAAQATAPPPPPAAAAASASVRHVPSAPASTTASSVLVPTYTSAGTAQLRGASPAHSQHSSRAAASSTGNGGRPTAAQARGAPVRVQEAEPRRTETTHVYDAASSEDSRPSPQPAHRRPNSALRVPTEEVVRLVPHDCIPASFHAPQPPPVLLDAVVPHPSRGADVLHYQPRQMPGAGDGSCPPGTVKLSTTTLTVEERKVRYLALDEPYDADAADPTDVKGTMPMADTFALLHPSDYGRVLLANQPAVLAITHDDHEPDSEDDPQQWAVQPTYLANNGHRWVRRSNRAPVATTRDPAGRAPEDARRLTQPPLTAAEARVRAGRAPFAAFPAYQVTNTMTNRAVRAEGGRHVEDVHDAAGGYLLQRHVQQTATGKLLDGTPSALPMTSVARRPAPASVPTSVGSRSQNSTPSSTRSAPVYRVPRTDASSTRPHPPRREPTVRGSAEDTRGPAAMVERLAAIPGYAHSGTRPPLPSHGIPPRLRPNPAAAHGWEASKRPGSDTAKPTTQPSSQAASSHVSSQAASQPQTQPPQQVSTALSARPASTVSGPRTPYVPSMSTSSTATSRASQPAVVRVPPSATVHVTSVHDHTPSIRSDVAHNATPATVGKLAHSGPPQPPRQLSISTTPSASSSVHSRNPPQPQPQPQKPVNAVAARPAPPPPPPAAPTRPLTDYARPKPVPQKTGLDSAASSERGVASVPAKDARLARPTGGVLAPSTATVAPPPAPPAPPSRAVPAPAPVGVSRPPANAAELDASAGSHSPTHSASPMHGPASDASFVSDGIDPVTEVQNHTIAAAHITTPHDAHVASRYTSTSPSLVQPYGEFAAHPASPPGQWLGVQSVPTMCNNNSSAPPAHAPVHDISVAMTAASSNSPSVTYEGRDQVEMMTFTRVDDPAHAPIPYEEHALGSTTVHHSSHSQSSVDNRKNSHGRHAYPAVEPGSADTLPIPVSERDDDDDDDDESLTKKVRPTTLIVDGEVFELPRHESEELYFVPDDNGDVYYDEQNREFYPAEKAAEDEEADEDNDGDQGPYEL